MMPGLKGQNQEPALGERGEKKARDPAWKGWAAAKRLWEQLKEKVRVRKEGPLDRQHGKSVEWHRELATVSP